MKYALALFVVVVVAAAAAIYCRASYGVFPWAGPPARIDRCGRRYYPERRKERVDARAFRSAFRAPPLIGARFYERRAAACSGVFYRDAGRGRGVAYVLSGGP